MRTPLLLSATIPTLRPTETPRKGVCAPQIRFEHWPGTRAIQLACHVLREPAGEGIARQGKPTLSERSDDMNQWVSILTVTLLQVDLG